MESQDIWVEVSHGPTLIDNNLLLSKDSLKIHQGLGVVNNLILGSFTYVGTGTETIQARAFRQRYTCITFHTGQRWLVFQLFFMAMTVSMFCTEVAPEKNPEIMKSGDACFDDYQPMMNGKRHLKNLPVVLLRKMMIWRQISAVHTTWAFASFGQAAT